jgi:putative addiction module component (TIGR02574 family)
VIERLLAVLESGDERSVLEAALQLDEAERWKVVDDLLATLPANGSGYDLHPSWEAEIKRRVAAIESGQAEWIPWEEVRAELIQRERE